MTGFVIGLGVWLIIGMIVIEWCRLWRAWWINPLSILTALLWPLVLMLTLLDRSER